MDSQDMNGNTALHIASYQGHPGTVCILISWGAGSFRNSQGRTPLDVAREEDEEEVVQILEERIRENNEVMLDF